MEKPSVTCALLATMLAKYRWGSPIGKDALLALSAIGNEYVAARNVYESLKAEPYITYHGNRGIELDASNFDLLADVLHYECNWDTWEIESRLKHYEGLDDHDWA